MTDDELEPTLAAARRAGPAWTAGRQQQLKWAVMGKVDKLDQTRWRRIPFLMPLLGAVALAAIGVLGWRQLVPSTPSGAPPIGSTASGSAERALPRLADGSSIVLDGPSAVLKKTVETSEEVAFQLEAGGAHFEVARRPSRIFRVHAGAVTVQVIGTRFHVQRQAARSRISVDRGKVLVSWWGGSRELTAGQEGTFPPAQRTESAAIVAPPPAAPPTPPPAIAPAGNERPSAIAAAASPEALFARADRARAAGKAELAITHLKEILDRHPSDPHAPMAAFTVGRLLLESLGQPRHAARAFARARVLANGGPLAEDALAREVEALHAAGDAPLARQRAQLYRQLFPNGPRLPAVTRFGGLQAAP